MDKDTDSLITDSQLTILVISSILGVGLFSLPNDVIKDAKQDGWISCILGAVYPLYMVFIASYFCKTHPKDNIYKLSNKCFGKFIGTILNSIFSLFFVLMGTAVASGMSNVLRIYITTFLSGSKLLLVFFLPPAFIAYKGLKTLARISEVIFYLTLILFFVPLAALRDGLLLNVMPIGGAGVINILKASKNTAFAYTGIEIIFLLYPFLQNSKNFKKDGVKGVLITIAIYTWFAFITIYYLGIDIIPKFIWSALIVTQPLVLPIINNFKAVFMVLWTGVMFRTMGIYYYGFTHSLSELIKKTPRKTFVFLVYPLFFYIALKYGNPTSRGNILDKIVPIYALFNIVFVSSIALILAIKKGGKNRNEQ